jgi:hypothetical protein
VSNTSGGVNLVDGLMLYTCKMGHCWVANPDNGFRIRLFSSESDRNLIAAKDTHFVETGMLCPYCVCEKLTEMFGAVTGVPYNRSEQKVDDNVVPNT